jgi:hypothetical protein
MLPVFPWHPGRMDFAATDLKSLAVHQKIAFANHEGVFVRRVRRRSSGRDSHAEREKSHNDGDGNETI